MPTRTSGRTSPRTPTDWFLDHDFIVLGAAAGTAKFLETFKEFPPSQRPASFTIDQAVEKMKQGLNKD
jgi:arylsulfatase